jgi:cell division protein FtsA
MQSGTVSDIDAVVVNCRKALDEAEQAAGLRPGSAVIGIAGELVKGSTAVRTVRREQPQAPLTDGELERIVQRVQGEALDEAEERIAWESGVERMEVRLVHAAVVEM